MQQVFGNIFNKDASFSTDGRQFDILLDESSEIQLGKMNFRAMHTPGHTPACMTYIFGNAAFVDDTLFMPMKA